MARILLIDDDDSFRLMLHETLELLDHEVVSLQNGVNLFESLKMNHFDLVITDLVMPEKDGLEVIMSLKKVNSGLKIIAISGGGRIRSDDYLRVAQILGASKTLSKPFSEEALIDAIRTVLA